MSDAVSGVAGRRVVKPGTGNGARTGAKAGRRDARDATGLSAASRSGLELLVEAMARGRGLKLPQRLREGLREAMCQGSNSGVVGGSEAKKKANADCGQHLARALYVVGERSPVSDRISVQAWASQCGGLRTCMIGEVYLAMLDAEQSGELDPRATVAASGRPQRSPGVSSRRRMLGMYYTPREIGRVVVWRAMRALTVDSASVGWMGSVLDPSCGAGGLLTIAARRMCRIGEDENSGRARRRLARMIAGDCRRSGECGVYGVDIDPVAVWLARITLWMEAGDDGVLEAVCSRVMCADALAAGAMARRKRSDAPTRASKVQNTHSAHDAAAAQMLGRVIVESGGFDVVVGNPPFVDSEAMTVGITDSDMCRNRRHIAAAFPSARGNWDLSVAFMELAIELARDGGRVGLVLPTRALSSRYAGALQERLLGCRIESLHRFGTGYGVRGVSTGIGACVVRKRQPARDSEVEFWEHDADRSLCERVRQETLRGLPRGFLAAGHGGQSVTSLMEVTLRGTRLGELALVRDGATTGEAYRIAEWTREEEGTPSRVRAGAQGLELARGEVERGGAVGLVNSGLVEPNGVLWGTRPIRYLGRRWEHPVVELERLRKEMPRRAEQAMGAKVVIAGLGTRLEAVALGEGMLCGKSAVQVLCGTRTGGEADRFGAVLCACAVSAVLNTDVLTRVYRLLFGARGFGGRCLSIGARQLEMLPMPRATALRPAAWDEQDEAAWEAAAMRALPRLESIGNEDLRSELAQEAWLSRLGRWMHASVLDGNVALAARLTGVTERVVVALTGLSRW